MMRAGIILLATLGASQASELQVSSNVEVYKHRDCEKRDDTTTFNTLPSGILQDYLGYLLQDSLGDVPKELMDVDCGGVGGGDDIGGGPSEGGGAPSGYENAGGGSSGGGGSFGGGGSGGGGGGHNNQPPCCETTPPTITTFSVPGPSVGSGLPGLISLIGFFVWRCKALLHQLAG